MHLPCTRPRKRLEDHVTAPSPLAPGHIDIHAHLLPEDCYEIPAADGTRRLAERTDDELYLGDFPIAVTRDQISGVPRILADMHAEDIAVRVVSAPPYAFAVTAEPDAAAEYARRVNEGLMRMCEGAPDRLIPLGVLPLQDRGATAAEVKQLVADGVRGVSVPPVVGSLTLGDPELHHVLDSCAAAGLAVLVHPTQQPRPGFNHHYLQNLIGNPVESATAIASILLGGTFERAPALRIAFVHGAGVAPALLGRWDHGWRMRGMSPPTATHPRANCSAPTCTPIRWPIRWRRALCSAAPSTPIASPWAPTTRSTWPIRTRSARRRRWASTEKCCAATR